MPYSHIVAVYDGTPPSEELLDIACRIARSQRARLTILHVNLVPLKERLPVYEPGKDPDTDARIAASEKFASKRGVQAAWAVRYARAVGPAVVAEARVRGADLIALAAQNAQRATGPGLSADAETVLHRAACAVMLYRPGR